LVAIKGQPSDLRKGRTQGGGSFHGNTTLHPKIVKQLIDAIAETSIQAMPPE